MKYGDKVIEFTFAYCCVSRILQSGEIVIRSARYGKGEREMQKFMCGVILKGGIESFVI